MVEYFNKNQRDTEFFNEHIAPRMPSELFDMHLHITRPKDTSGISQEAVDKDWALQCGYSMDIDDLKHYCETLWCDRRVSVTAFPFPVRGVDLRSANKYLAKLLKDENNLNANVSVRAAAMSIAPSFDCDECEQQMLDYGFIGYKPYPDLVSGEKGADISIFDFIPDRFLRALDKHKRAVILHLPRAKRIADPDNIKELLRMRQTFPDVKIIVAHYGRSYNIEVIEKAFAEFGSDINGFYFDNAAVLNPAVHTFMLEHIPHDRIFFGTDMPILMWHGKRTWQNGTYQNFSRETFKWNSGKTTSAEEEEKYTFLLYEQAKYLLDSIYSIGGRELAEDIYCNNAKRFLRGVGCNV
ncbi:MAG: amidohydrolase family protein [Clostridia bacterium]|nr:amidohydrolase family protein [Clostridia bacterium]